MFSSFESWVAFRFLLSKRHSTFLSFIAVIAILGVVIGVTALSVVISVMEGLETELKSRILGNSSHIHMMKYGYGHIDEYTKLQNELYTIDGIKSVLPTIMKEGLAISPVSLSSGVMIKGIDLSPSPHISKIESSLISPIPLLPLKQLLQDDPTAPSPIILGRELAESLLLSINDTVDLVIPYGELTPFGNYPRKSTFRVAGIFHSGMWEYDTRFIFMKLNHAQSFFNFSDVVNGFEIDVNDIDTTRSIIRKIDKIYDNKYLLRDWKHLHGSFFSALQLEKTAMFLILTMIVIVAAFNIIALLMMAVKEKSKDISILMSMGATKQNILKIFMMQGSFIGIIGTFTGMALGIVLSFLLKEYIKFPLNPEVYFIETLPVKMDPINFLIIGMSSILISFIATLYPAYRAAKMNPIEGLRYE